MIDDLFSIYVTHGAGCRCRCSDLDARFFTSNFDSEIFVDFSFPNCRVDAFVCFSLNCIIRSLKKFGDFYLRWRTPWAGARYWRIPPANTNKRILLASVRELKKKTEKKMKKRGWALGKQQTAWILKLIPLSPTVIIPNGSRMSYTPERAHTRPRGVIDYSSRIVTFWINRYLRITHLQRIICEWELTGRCAAVGSCWCCWCWIASDGLPVKGTSFSFFFSSNKTYKSFHAVYVTSTQYIWMSLNSFYKFLDEIRPRFGRMEPRKVE